MAKNKPYKVLIFRDDPIWDKLKRWFYISNHDYRRLFVASIEFPVDEYGDIYAMTPDGTEILSSNQAIKYAERMYPGHVIVG